VQTQSEPRVGVGSVVLLFDEDDNILVAKRIKNRKYGVPGGKLEFGESPLQAAIRELWEETRIKVPSLYPLGLVASNYYPDDLEHWLAIWFYARIKHQKVSYVERDKQGKRKNFGWRWVQPKQLYKLPVMPSIIPAYEYMRKELGRGVCYGPSLANTHAAIIHTVTSK
jgi:8-oxo-dGTP pyrophosphatase MutT (NUDIX family)